MTIVIKKNDDIKEIKKKLRLSNSGKKMDASKYAGKIKLTFDPLEYQKKIRAEWDESDR
ncbi:MAG: hypothetical protein ABJR05_00540 [Balneola sp.]